MKKAFLFMSFTGLLIGCTRHTAPVNTAVKLSDSYYTGGNGWHIAFLKIANDTAFADFVSIEKFPRELHSDTLLYNSSNNSWKGKTSSLYEQKGSLHISSRYTAATTMDPVEATIHLKIKPDEAGYKKSADVNKNYAYANQYYNAFLKKYKDNISDRPAYWNILEKYQLSYETLPHADFVKEFDKFKAEIEKK